MLSFANRFQRAKRWLIGLAMAGIPLAVAFSCSPDSLSFLKFDDDDDDGYYYDFGYGGDCFYYDCYGYGDYYYGGDYYYYDGY